MSEEIKLWGLDGESLYEMTLCKVDAIFRHKFKLLAELLTEQVKEFGVSPEIVIDIKYVKDEDNN